MLLIEMKIIILMRLRLQYHLKKTIGDIMKPIMKDENGKIVNSPVVKTPQPRKFVAYEDPGHGWVKVSLFLLRKLNIADKITSCSYQRGDYVYLEEDCDFSTFYDAMSRADKAIKIESRHTDKQSKIRSYEPYQYKEV